MTIKGFGDSIMSEYYQRAQRQSGEGRPPITCPTTYKEPCRLCAFCYEILKDRSLKGTKLSEEALNLNQKHRYYSNITFPGINPSQVVVFEYGDKIFKKLIGYQMDPTGQEALRNFMDPINGRNLFIKKTIGTTKKQTDYDVEYSIERSRLPDMSVLEHLFPLDEILALIKAGTVVPYYQAKLEKNRTEIRILSSWLGPGSSLFFFPVNYHYGISEEDFNAIQAGELDPFARVVQDSPVTYSVSMGPTAEKLIEKPEQHQIERPKVLDNPWAGYLSSKPPTEMLDPKPIIIETPSVGQGIDQSIKSSETQDDGSPSCKRFGEYNPNDKLCTVVCKDSGWSEPCKLITLEKENRRKAAKRIVGK